MPINFKELSQQRIYNITTNPAEALSDLDDIAEMTVIAKHKQEQYNKQGFHCLLGLGLTIALVILISSVFTSGNNLQPGINFILILASISLLITSIYFFTKAGKYKSLSTNDYRLKLSQKVLQMLARDMDSNTIIYMQLSFKNLQERENIANTIPHPYKPNWKIDNYRMEWLDVKGKFLDKARFSLTLAQLSKTQYGWKRSRSGKSKHKSKTKKIGLDVCLKLNYPQRRYGSVNNLKNEIKRAVKLPSFTVLRGLEVNDKFIYIVVRIPPENSEMEQEVYQTITMLLLSIYQVLNFAKSLVKANNG